MDDQRDIQVSKLNGGSKSFISAGSAVDMEIKRKRIRQSALFLPTEVGFTTKTGLNLSSRQGLKSDQMNANQPLFACLL